MAKRNQASVPAQAPVVVAPIEAPKVETPVAFVLSAERTAEAQKLAASFFAMSDAADNTKAEAFDVLNACGGVDEVNAVRDAFKAAYATGYDARFPNGDKDKRTNACNMAWSRVCSYAKERGWIKPMSTGTKATKAREGRAVESAGKTDGRTAKARESGKVAGVIVAKDDLDAAMDVLRANPQLRAMFDVWFAKAQVAADALKALAA